MNDPPMVRPDNGRPPIRKATSLAHSRRFGATLHASGAEESDR
jgi:hypothetical protein